MASKFAHYSDITNLSLNFSLVYYKKALEINREIYATDENTTFAQNLMGIASVYDSLGRHEEALKNYENSLTINRKLFGTDHHTSVAIALNNIASVYNNLGRYEDALDNLEKSLLIK